MEDKSRELFDKLKEREEELNNICRQKGFELNIVDNGELYNGRAVKIHIKTMDNNFITNFTLSVGITFGGGNDDEIISINGNGVKTYINDIPKWIYNYLNYDKVQYVCNFIGGEYDGQTMNREEIEKICFTSTDIFIPKVNENELSPFVDVIRYIPIIPFYYSKRPKVDFGTIYYTYVEKKFKRNL